MIWTKRDTMLINNIPEDLLTTNQANFFFEEEIERRI